MTRVEIMPGPCGFLTEVRARKGDGRQADIMVVSDCDKVAALAREVSTLKLAEIFTPMDKNPVITGAGRHGLHSVCPVPCGILKVVEAELGLAVKRDLTIRFMEDES
jgi:hypothetical protein